MRVTHRMLSQSVTRNLQRNLRSLDRRSLQLASGRTFDRPSEDPVGTYKVMKITGTGLARNEQYRRNIGEGLSWLTMSEDSLAEAIDVIHRLQELSVYGANAIHSPGERQAMAPEVRQLLEQLVGIANTELAGLYVFGGYKTQTAPYQVAGSEGEIINYWQNNYSGLAGSEDEIYLDMDNLATGTYAISTALEYKAIPDSNVVPATIVAQHLPGARDSFFGTDNISFNLDNHQDANGSVALEVLGTIRYQDLTDEQKAAVGEGGEDDRIVRLGARYYLYGLDGELREGVCGVEEDILINLNGMYLKDQTTISLPIKSSDESIRQLEITVATPEALTFEKEIPMVGDKLVLQFAPSLCEEVNYERFTLHKDYGGLDENGRPASGIHLDWYFNAGTLGPEPPQTVKTRTLKFFDLDKITGELLTSTIEPKFSNFTVTDGQSRYWDPDELRSGLIADEEWAGCPAAIFTYIAPDEPYYVGDTFNREVEISPGVAVRTSTNGVEAFGEREIFEVVLQMEKALLHNDQVALGGTILEKLGSQLDRLLKCRSEIGARMERLLITDERYVSEQIYLRELRSKVEDIDAAEAITEFMMQENAY
ncbi:MAG TPA: flagellar hook-associated protein FlgL, partial [Firmicutes bacterium]|nr:flagellar hook-associated protein FlgL [Bacillota bacterium]